MVDKLGFSQLVSDSRISGCHQQYVSSLADLVCCMLPTLLKPPSFVGRETYLQTVGWGHYNLLRSTTKDMYDYT